MVLLVVDTQKGIVDERLYAFEKFVSNIKELIRTCSATRFLRNSDRIIEKK